MKICSRSILAAFCAMLAASALFADETQVSAERPQAATEPALAENHASAATTSSIKVVRDKETGKLRAPNAKELRELEELEAAANAAKGPSSLPATSDTTITRSASGTASAMLGTEHLMSLQGVRTEDGSIRKSHSEGADKPATTDELPTE